VIVRQLPGAGSAAENLVERVGGSVLSRLSIINGFSASVPASALPLLQGLPGVFAVTEDAQVRVQTGEDDPATDTGSLHSTAEIIEADYMYGRGYTGAGIGVALIDTGVVPVEGLHDGVMHGPDLSFEGPDPSLRYLDTHGHGTHMAEIISGRDAGWSPGDRRPSAASPLTPTSSASRWRSPTAWPTSPRSSPRSTGWSPTARTQHSRAQPRLRHHGIQDRRLDPLSHAVEHAWHKGIVVVEVGIDLEIAVNLSTWSLLDVHLADDIRGLLGEYAMPPRRLRLEITETSMMADPHRSAEILTMISDMKVGLSVDDFGTGTRRWRG
jgi:serine protease AprX